MRTQEEFEVNRRRTPSERLEIAFKLAESAPILTEAGHAWRRKKEDTKK
jgi:hypothetical protein